MPRGTRQTWAWLAGIAVVGSLIYGISLGSVLHWDLWGSGLWLMLSAGLSWCLFGPVLVLVTRSSIPVCVQACLVTMAYGEGILFLGALFNVLFASNLSRDLAGWINAAWVGGADVVMAGMLTAQLATQGVKPLKTLVLWVIVLNGSGALLFLWLRPLLRGDL